MARVRVSLMLEKTKSSFHCFAAFGATIQTLHTSVSLQSVPDCCVLGGRWWTRFGKICPCTAMANLCQRHTAAEVVVW